MDTPMHAHIQDATGPGLVDISTYSLEWQADDPACALHTDLYGCFADRLGHRGGNNTAPWQVVPSGGPISHQSQGTPCHLEVTAATTDPSSLASPALYRQHISDCLHQQIWWYPILYPQQPGSQDLVSLLQPPYPPIHSLRPFTIQPGGRPLSPDDSPERLGNHTTDVQPTRPNVGPPLHRPLRISNQHQDSPALRHLAPPPERSLDQRLLTGLAQHPGSPVPLPSVEPPPSPTTASGRHPDHAELANSPLVADSPDVDTISSTPPPTHRHFTRSKRSRDDDDVAFDRLEHLSKRIRTTTLDTDVMDTITTASSQLSRNRSYTPHQQRFHLYCHSIGRSPDVPHLPTILNFLQSERNLKSWSVGSTRNAKTAIFDLYSPTEKTALYNDRLHVEYVKALKASHVPRHQAFDYDLSPIFTHILSLVSNQAMSFLQLSGKTAWLPPPFGPPPRRFRSVQGCSYIKTVTIQPHTDSDLCPVAAFTSYCHRFAAQPARRPHPSRPHLTLNYLFRHRDTPTTPVVSTTIARHINSIMDLIGKPGSVPVPKARALASTLAAQAGLKVDDIVAHGSWSSVATFSNFYRLSSESQTNFTTSTLDQQPRSQSGKCNVM
ncbi:unnamed protein product [Absidia cylindrospora]